MVLTLPLLLYLLEVFSADTSPPRGPPAILSRKDNEQRNAVLFFEIFYVPITQIPRPSNSMLGCMW